MVSTKTMMPTPPIHWVNERHQSSVWGSSSGWVTTVAPVVVKPAIDSKKALVMSANGEARPAGNRNEVKYRGSAPSAVATNHPRAAMISACFSWVGPARRRGKYRSAQRPTDASAVNPSGKMA